MIVGQTPWSAADALVGLLRWREMRVQGDPRGPGGPPYTVGSPWTSISSGSTPSRAGSGRRPVRWAQPQNIAVVELKTPAMAPMVRGSQGWLEIAARVMDTIMTLHCTLSMVEKTRPRYPSATLRNSCVIFSPLETATAVRERAMKNKAQAKLRIWLKTMYEPP